METFELIMSFAQLHHIFDIKIINGTLYKIHEIAKNPLWAMVL